MDFANLDTSSFLIDYLPVVLFIIISSVIIVAFLLVSYVIVPQNPTKNKLEPYECGYDAFTDTKKPFDIRFYLVAILFILFDIEIIFMYPWAIALKEISDIGFYSMILFIFILTLGFIYEWKKGALKWN